MSLLLRCLSLLLTLHFVLAGPPRACSLPGYDINTLYNANYWEFDVPSSYCADGQCKVFFSICKQLPADICGDAVYFCERDRDSSSPAYVATGYTYSQSGVSFSFKWIGGNFSNCSEVVTSIVFSCSRYARWNSTYPNVSHYITSFNRDPINACNMSVSMEYSGACLTPPTSTMHPSTPYVRHSYRKLAVVVVITVLCILVGVILFYFIVGVIFQVAFKKERGIRVFPNYDFWHDLCTSVLCCAGCRGRGAKRYGRLGPEQGEDL